MRTMYCSRPRPDVLYLACTAGRSAGLSGGAGMPMMVELHRSAGSKPPRYPAGGHLPHFQVIRASSPPNFTAPLDKAARCPERTPHHP